MLSYSRSRPIQSSQKAHVHEKSLIPSNELRSYAGEPSILVCNRKTYAPPERNTIIALPNRTKHKPWKLKTPPGTSEYTLHTDEEDGCKILVCTVGKTVLHYDARCVGDLHAMLRENGEWVELGGADEQKPAKEGTVEA
jgi:hypothetical protein